MNHSKEQIISMLRKRWEYEPYLIEDVIKQIYKMDPALQDSFEEYIASEQFPIEPVYFGLTPKVISENYTFAPPAVFLMLDWIRSKPMEGLEFLVNEYRKPLPVEFDRKALSKVKKNKN